MSERAYAFIAAPQRTAGDRGIRARGQTARERRTCALPEADVGNLVIRGLPCGGPHAYNGAA